jgi:hypothetical protein
MARIVIIICLVALAFIAAGKFTSQPHLPRSMQSDDFLWELFARCELKTNRDYSNSISYLPDVKAMNGKKITISGFMVPIESKEKFGHFLLSRRAPSCPFCPPAEPNEMMEVFSAKPVRWQENLVTLSGTLILVNDAKREIFFQMQDTAGS